MTMFNSNFIQGFFVPKNISKCLNFNGALGTEKKITFRSSWEEIFCNFCDSQESVKSWGNEIIKIPYYFTIDNKSHVYITDFIMEVINRKGESVRYIVEIKPDSQSEHLNKAGDLIYPDPPKRKTQKSLSNWQDRCMVIRRNHEKWQMARKWCSEHGFIFKVVNEKDLDLLIKHVGGK